MTRLNEHDHDKMNRISKALLIALFTLLLLGPTALAATPQENFKTGYERHQSGRLNDAISYYNKAINANPSYVLAYQMRAAAWHQKKEHSQARADYSKVIELGDPFFKAVGYFNRGIVNYDDGRFTQAIMDLTEAISRDHKMTQAYVHRGIAKSKIGDKKGQIKDFTYAAKFGDKKVRNWLETHAPHVLKQKR
ncbi:MAG: hypothetical protein C1942_06560 [Prosthecochloris sp.]|uniref:tetratricopeptide repeat protein n=1 Tax=Prosthecochloris sp. TaxID=290513 RepID=UPI0013CA2358|nr:hypothetical protein [Prosthecochloris sp.]NEX12340.1 hypothetical protein [Prosthecochloris sp.]